MYNLIEKKLAERGRPIRVAVIGIGWFGSRLVPELHRAKKMEPSVLIDRNIEKAVKGFLDIGIPGSDIAVVNSAAEMTNARANGKRIAFADLRLVEDLEDIDVVYECTGDILGGTQAAVAAIGNGVHYVTVNAETDATIGLALARLAEQKGVVYSNSDGDQPGCLARIIREAEAYGFEPKIAGNCKGFIDLHQNPKGVRPYVLPGHDVNKVCSFADGTKQSFELTVVGNAFGYTPLKRGMFGPTTTKERLVAHFDRLVDLNKLKGGHVDFVLGLDGVDQGAGVFVIASRQDGTVVDDMKYLKKGTGPNYLFFRDHHLCHLEALSSIAEAVLFETATICPKNHVADVLTVAKRDMEAGHSLDELGGFDYYGLVERAETVRAENLLPAGLAEFATLKQAVTKDTPITYDMVELEDNLVTTMRRKMDSEAAATVRAEQMVREAFA